MENTSNQTVRDARERFFAENGFSLADYRARWVRLRLGPLSLFIPNTASRKRAVARHDLHHLATGYGTDWRGESEISAWEVAAGCGDYWAAWLFGIGGIAMGAIIAPARTWRAWRRGRASRTLYDGRPIDELLDLSVAELQERLEVGRA